MARFSLLLLFTLGASLCWSASDTTNLTVTIDKVAYSNVTWGTVTPVSATMFHSTGIAVVPLDKLPPELQQRFDYDPRKAAEFRAAEKKADETGDLRWDRDKTSKQIAYAMGNFGSILQDFDWDLRHNSVDRMRGRYRALLDLKKLGHKDYQPSIALCIEACKRAIERHYLLQKEKPEYRTAKRNFENFQQSKNAVIDNQRFKELSRIKAEADAFYKERQRLSDEALLARSEGLRAKERADMKGQPPPPTPQKPSITDPYLVEAP